MPFFFKTIIQSDKGVIVLFDVLRPGGIVWKSV